MIKCKIGLISLPLDGNMDFCVHLGEVFDKVIKNDKRALYELHSNLRFLYPLKLEINDTSIVPDNLEDIRYFQIKYKMTRKVYIDNPRKNNTYKYRKPQLYDITCMTPLFTDEIPRSVCPVTTHNKTRVFVLLPYLSPVVRGELVDRCLTMISNETTGVFFTMGKNKGSNVKSTCDLYRRYLLTCGVEDSNINKTEYDEFPDCISETLVFVDLIVGSVDHDIYMCVSTEEIGNLLNCVKLLTKLGMLKTPVKFICN